MQPTLDRTQTLQLLDYARTLGLSHGLGKAEPGFACAEHLKNIVAGTPRQGDKPLPCVDPYDNRLAIRTNDRIGWLDNTDRGKGMARILVMQLGTRGTDRMPMKLALQEELIRHIVPIALRAAAKWNPDRAPEIEAAAVRCETEGTKAATLAARNLCLGVWRTTVAADAATVAADVAADAADVAADVAADAADAAAAAAAAARFTARRDVLLAFVGCIERAYERTGSAGLDLLREIEAEQRA